MRIISGTLGGRVLHPPKDLPVRPTTDLAKTALFNILANRINLEEANVLDLCCGTGSISFECASRGAKNVTAIDTHFNCVKFVNDTAKTLGISNLKAFKADVFKFIESQKTTFDFIFADPPYKASWIEEISKFVFRHKLLSPKGILIIEHGSKTDLSTDDYFIEKRTYGNVNFSIFKPDAIAISKTKSNKNNELYE
ncbi:MAG TPA: RsmD family RNA methyltransferase [Bacteroidia bacterium]